MDVQGPVRATAYYTGDLCFQKDGRKFWRMFEDEAGLDLESLTTGRKFNVILQELGSCHPAEADAAIASLKAENAALNQRMVELEAKLHTLMDKLQ